MGYSQCVEVVEAILEIVQAAVVVIHRSLSLAEPPFRAVRRLHLRIESVARLAPICLLAFAARDLLNPKLVRALIDYHL